jgi:hypothetical protein
MAGLLPDAEKDTVLPNWVSVMVTIMHIGVERSDQNNVAVEVINSRNCVI